MTATGSSDPVPLIDARQYQIMAGALGNSFEELLVDFFGECERCSIGLVESAEAGDAAGFREFCHETKGSAGMLGFRAIANCAADWETLANDGKVPDSGIVAERFPPLVAETQKAAGEMKSS
jgi:HPt (histidine-containing phosphotransfer) domain-containing protein